MNDHLAFHLPEEFVNSYADRVAPWGFSIGAGNSLGELTFINKYSRRKPDGTKERWSETCRRVIEGMYSILKEHCLHNKTPWNENKATRSAMDAYERLFTFKWTPPGRGLWMMGTEFVNGKKNSAALQNCFIGNEKFITKEHGPATFAELVDEVVTVWTHDGWKKADVREFGTQPVQSITFAPARGSGRPMRSNHRVSVTATPDHRWLLQGGTETTALAVGDVVRAAVPTWDESGDHWEGVAHGLIFGDGVRITHRYANGDYGYELRACDDRTKDLVVEHGDMFDKINWDRPSANGDPICSKRSPRELKSLPVGESTEYVAGFLRGWICADASQNPSGTWILASQYPGAYEWLKDNAATAGWIVTGHSQDLRDTNFGPRSAPLAKISLSSGESLLAWKVTAIEELPEEEPVYCAVVQDTAAFALASGIYTGNCAFISTEKISSRSVKEATLPFVRLMEMSMLGIGAGFDTKGEGKLLIHEPSMEKPEFVVIEDSREGWFESTGRLLEMFFFENRPWVVFDYSLVRPAGEPIKGFGGTAAGPGPLKELHDSIRSLFWGRAGQRISSTDIVDVMNMIGKCVVAGGVRRTAEIALGPADDKAFLELKNAKVNPERMGVEDWTEDGEPIWSQSGGWGFTSNNSVFAEVGGNYDHLVERIMDNGEPGLLYLDLCREYGRLVDPPNNRDYRVAGTNPCGEQSLESYECCTLVETFPINCQDLDDWLATLKVAYLFAKAVTLLPTHWPETNEIMQRNRRIGCSVSGEAQFAERHGVTELKRWLDVGYHAVVERDIQYSEWLGVRESIKRTSVKPSGTVSLLAGVTPGVHWPTGHGTYVRRVRYAKDDPSLSIIRAAGYRTEADVMDPKHTVVVDFPTVGPSVRSERDVTVWEKAHLAALHQRHWADNQVSVTLTFSEQEREQVGPVLRAFDGQLKSLSMLPMHDSGAYAQMPYESISEEAWEKMTKKVLPLDWDALYAGSRDAEGERFCNNDRCELPG